LWDIRGDITASVADEIIYDGLDAIPSNSTFLQYRKAILDADVFDYNGSHLNTIAHDFYLRGIGNDVETVSGTLSSSQTWSDYVQLSGNVSVHSGVTLIIAASAVINLCNGSNTYSLISTGGVISLQSGATINGWTACLKSWSSTKGFFPTIQSAINNASNGDGIEVNNGTYNGDITINNKIVTLYGQSVSGTIINGVVWFENCEGGQLYNLTSDYIEMDGCNNINTWGHKIITGSGLFCYSSTDLDVSPVASYPDDIALEFIYGTNGLIDLYAQLTNSWIGAYLYNYSNATITTTTFCSNSIDIEAINYSSADADASENKFSSDPVSYIGNVSVPGYITICSMPKRSKLSIASINNMMATYPNYEKFSSLIKLYFALTKIVKNDTKQTGKFHQAKFLSRYYNIIDSMKTFIQNNPG